MSFQNFLAEFGAVIFGLIVGAVAHFGRLFMEHTPPTGLQALGYVMQLGMVGLAAAASVTYLDIQDPLIHAMTAAMFALTAQEVVNWFKKKGFKVLLERVFDIKSDEK